MTAEVEVYPDAVSLATAAAERFISLATLAVAKRGRFSVALAGGSTPKGMYALLATDKFASSLDWSRVHFFWGDERCVPPVHPSSNYRMACESLLDHLPLSPVNVHRIHGEMEPEKAAQTYSDDLVAFFAAPLPSFDLVLLGLGDDGHTASLFPNSAVLWEEFRPVAPVVAHYQGRPAHRVTLTPLAINGAHQVLFLVSGAVKAGIVREVLEGPSERYPAQMIRPVDGELTWMLDIAAAGQA
jgi:6-phosphogluconolactonase